MLLPDNPAQHPALRALARLRAQHREIAARLDTLDAIFAGGQPDQSAYVAARWQLTKASRARWRLLANEVIPLLQTLPEAWRGAVEDLLDDGEVQQEASLRHVTRWPLPAAIADWEAYRLASNAIRAGMRGRVAREAALIYPALAQLAAPPAAP